MGQKSGNFRAVMTGKTYYQLESLEAMHIENHYVCASCWGTLITQRVKPEERLFKVICKKCGEDRGFVTREYAEKRRGESKVEAVEVRRNLGKVLGLKEKPIDLEKTIEKLWN